MKIGDYLVQACADCGDVVPLDCVSFTCVRPLCPLCLHDNQQPAKQAAEVWLLEEMYQRSAA